VVALYGVGHQRSADFVSAVGGGGGWGVDERERREIKGVKGMEEAVLRIRIRDPVPF
jgi:hypothetical protein